MKFRLVASGLAVAAFSIGLASLVQTDAVGGRGKALGDDGQLAQMSFGTSKVSHNDAFTVQGNFEFQAVVPPSGGDGGGGGDKPKTGGVQVQLRMKSPQALSLQANAGHFEGPGQLKVKVADKWSCFDGQVSVDAISNKHRGEQGDPDLLTVNFTPTSPSGPTYHFGGHMTDGDLEVSSHQSY